MSRWHAILGGLLALAALAHRPVLAQDSIRWRYQSPADIDAFTFTEDGMIVAHSDSGVVTLNAATGVPVWASRQATDYWLLARNTLRLTTPSGTIVVDRWTGDARWSSEDLPPGKWHRSLALEAFNLMLLLGETETGLNSLLAVSLDSGIVLWRQDSLIVPPLKPKVARDVWLTIAQPALVAADTSLVLFPTHGGVMRLDLRTGAVRWRVDRLAKAEPLMVRWGYARMLTDSNMIVVPYGRRLMALNADDGSIMWDHPKDYPAALAEMVMTPKGLLVRGYHKETKPGSVASAFVDLLDPATGLSRWPKPVRGLNSASAMLVLDDTIFLASDDFLYRVGLTSGIKEPPTEYWLRGDETPFALEYRDGDLVLWSEHNLVRLGLDGERKFEEYYGAPGASLFTKIAAVALIVGAAALTPPGQVLPYSAPPLPSVVDGRYKELLEAHKSVYMLTGRHDEAGRSGPNIVRLDKASGKVTGRVWVDDKSPDYAIDSSKDIVYLLRNKRELVALPF